MGERLSPYVSICCVIMAVCIMSSVTDDSAHIVDLRADKVTYRLLCLLDRRI